MKEDFFDAYAVFTPMFRFVLVDPEQRLFVAERFCFRGSVDDWIGLRQGGPAPLKDLLGKYVKHFGEESFYELW